MTASPTLALLWTNEAGFEVRKGFLEACLGRCFCYPTFSQKLGREGIRDANARRHYLTDTKWMFWTSKTATIIIDYVIKVKSLTDQSINLSDNVCIMQSKTSRSQLLMVSLRIFHLLIRVCKVEQENKYKRDFCLIWHLNNCKGWSTCCKKKEENLNQMGLNYEKVSTRFRSENLLGKNK